MSIKVGKWERKAKKNPEVLPAPQPAATIAMAQAGVPINRGNSDKVPLSPRGVADADMVGKELAAKGGVDSIKSDDSIRTQQTAQEVAKENPKQAPVQTDPNLGAWSQGSLEGQPKKLVGQHIQDLIRHDPQHVIEGQGAMSTRSGESFDQFRTRVLTSVMAEMHQLSQNPTARRVIINHSSSGNLVKAWLAAGAQDNFSIKPEVMNSPAPKAGTAERLFPDPDGKWKITPVDMKSPTGLPPGIYFVHHGLTPQNEQNYKTANASQEILRQIKAYVKSNDWPRLQALALKAVKAGQLTEQSLEKAVDSALPQGNAFNQLPLHHMMASASAASPAKRKAYAPALHTAAQSAIRQVPPHMGAEVLDHMRLLGLGRNPKTNPSPAVAG